MAAGPLVTPRSPAHALRDWPVKQTSLKGQTLRRTRVPLLSELEQVAQSDETADFVLQLGTMQVLGDRNLDQGLQYE